MMHPFAISGLRIAAERHAADYELLSNAHRAPESDQLSSLIEADMGAYYNWLGQQRFSGAPQSSFLVWFENQPEALAISPTLPRGTQSSKAANVSELFQWIS
jgi:hypothetical protein